MHRQWPYGPWLEYEEWAWNRFFTVQEVPNYLPSISAAIGGFTPQRYVWRACIGLHCAPRFLVAFTYYNFHMSVRLAEKNKLYGHLAAVACVLHIIENLALLGLTYVASNENHYAHEKFFITFLVSSLFYMLFTIILVKWGRTYDGRKMTSRERKSYSTKFSLFAFNISCCFIAAYVYWRHNKYCEPGVFTMFALSEYLIVATNIWFHYNWMSSDLSNTLWINISLEDRKHYLPI
ncbi:post-GPI attachment to proteins factor 2 isoform X2 [Octopus bimaculoides]|uniref:post-GPI attachment to proteins factor 2 isoform X2 n=1 Tax=Octopus bimaculoides TaxID=37653 RepID=UPI0022E2CD77|nr:post-GPI attachment to proteins factor 2 isoform X2 [Octopus bimaculoides]